MTDLSPSMLRHQWLEKATDLFRKHFKDCYYIVPDNVRLSIGFPIGGRDGKRVLGICHQTEWSADSHWEIFISPEYVDSKEILETIAHELIHATVQVPGHRGPFKKCAIAVGFIGPFTYTPAGPVMLEVISKIIAEIGEYPAGSLSLEKRKKQKTYLLKCSCAECGYNCRVTAKWVDQAGTPVCPVDEVQMEVE